MPVVKLTQELIDSVELQCSPTKLRTEFCDSTQPGLYVLVSSKGNVRSYFLRFKSPDTGRTTHIKLGRTTDIDLDEARRRAKTLKAEITLGKDPRKEANDKKKIPTLTEFMEEQYIPYQKERILGWSRQSDLFKNHLQSTFGNQPLDKISLYSVQQHLTSLRNKGYAASTCNHPIRVLCHATSLACTWNIIETNQLSGLSLIREDNQINNIMTETELSRLLTVLRKDKNKVVCAVCLFLLSTGARLNEALRARWEHVHIADRIWTIPIAHSKSRKVRSIPLNDSAIDVLDQLGTEGKYEHLFINRKTGNRYVAVHKAWDQLRREAGLPKLRIHDLRHQYASFLVNSGRTLYEVSVILGHSDQSVTQRYAHLSTKSLQDAADSASTIIAASMPK